MSDTGSYLGLKIDEAKHKAGETTEATKHKAGETTEATKQKAGETTKAAKQKTAEATEAAKHKTVEALEAAKHKAGEYAKESAVAGKDKTGSVIQQVGLLWPSIHITLSTAKHIDHTHHVHNLISNSLR